MNRRTLFIIGGAIALIALVALLWMWFLNRPTPAPSTTGTFGTATSTGGTGGLGTGGPGGGGVGTVTQGGAVSAGGGAITQGGVLSGPTVGGEIPVAAPVTPAGVQWLGGDTIGGTGVVGGGGLGSAFTPRTINQLNGGNLSGTPTILGNTPGGGGGGDSGDGLGAALIGAGIGVAACTAGFVTSGAFSSGIVAANRLTAVPVSDAVTNTGTVDTAVRENFLNCITRGLARAALQQLTASVVNWINSGFKGSPSFVTNYRQFFQNVADQAAGEYIKGSALSFLCSPFQLQIRIAIAQSYANRNAASCTLSKVVGNVNSFMNGNFKSGGWPGLLQFTTIPTNNPYGAFAYAQVGLQNAQLNAASNANRNMTATGFLSFQQPYDCKVAPGPNQDGSAGVPTDCKYKTVTPGSVIESSLNNTLETSARTLEQAGISGSFDAIISALISQLMTRTLYGGLSNLSGPSGYQTNFLTPEQQQAQDRARALMLQLQADVTLAQQYGQSEQGSIQDIQNAQQQQSTLQNCWLNWVGGSLAQEKQNLAAGRALSASSTIAQLNTRVDAHNNNITRANAAIVTLQDLQTRALNVASSADVAALNNSYSTAKSAGKILVQSDVTFSQQDRATLQTELAQLNQSTSSGLTQCYAFGN